MSREDHLRRILKAHGLHPRHALGQNFLVSRANLDRVAEAARVGPDDVVLEIGTGLGRLTERLADRAAHVVSVEVDAGLHAVACERLAARVNVTLVHADFLAGKHAVNPDVTRAVRRALGERRAPVRVAGNLPYSISSPAVVNLLEWELPVGEMCLMLQKEVADRLLAAPGTSDYGPLSVTVSYWADVERVFNLPPRAFWPAPEVTSTLVRVVTRASIGTEADYARFAAVARRVFQSRRKTLGACLKAGWGPQARDLVASGTGLEPSRRVDTLTAEEIVSIARVAGLPTR